MKKYVLWNCLAAIAALPAAAASPADVESLKTAYLRCEAEAAKRLLDPGTAAVCSAVHERLLWTAFGGDYRRLLAWWRAERAAATSRDAAAAG